MKLKAWNKSAMLGKASLLCVLLCIVADALAQERPLEAWWLQARFSADSTNYMGVDISTIDPNWVKMTVLSYKRLPAEAKSDLGWMRKGGFAFVKEGHLSHKRFVERAAVGVFEDRFGNGGRFLLVLRKDTSGAWKKVFLHKEIGDLGFSVLVSKGRRIYWGTCMQCENFRTLAINETGASLD
jgi:hypothetical protein